ncbi:MAG: hypothetical protein K2Q26_10330 [Bdellovibrionales bacterium]|nr:hypothetical protein [Bdellovibrionales bacterium]
MNKALFLAICFLSFQLFGHGEEKPGPHGGVIEMAKNVHTEVNADKDGSFHIFLLDGNIESPTVKNSSLEATIKSAKKDVKLICSVMGGTHFHCKSKEARPNEGKLLLKAKRDGVSVEVSYDLAAFKVASEKEEDHSNH